MALVTSDMFDSLLSLPVNEATPGFGTAIKVKKDNYSQLVAHRNLLTYSTGEILHACPRKFQLMKMKADAGTTERANSPTFAFGHAVGAGVAVFDETDNLREAIWAAFLAWDIDLLDGERKEGKRYGKSFWEAVWALYEYRTFREDETNLREYETVKIEATIAIDFENGYYYSGHIDELLRHRETGRHLVKENKTSGFSVIDAALYANSSQALSYSIPIDMLGGTEYEVLYTVYSVPSQRWLQFSFPKSSTQKAEWLQDQLCTHSHIDGFTELNFFPMRGASCFSFMRRCEFFESCQLSTDTVFHKRYASLPAIKSLDDIDALEKIDYRTTFSEIIKRQQAKLQGE